MPDVRPGQAQSAPTPVEMITEILNREKVTPNKPPEEIKAQPETDAETPVEAPEEAPAETSGDARMAEIPLDQLEAIELETTYKGEDGADVTEKLPIKELRKGYMQAKDYYRKTAELARQREEVGQKIRQGIESERQSYAQTLNQLQAAIIETAAPELKNVDWNKLATDDPFEYVKLRNRAEQISSMLNSVKQKADEVKAKAEGEQREVIRQNAQKTWSQLQSDIPGWGDALYKNIIKAATSVGYSEAEAGSWLDPKALKLAHKAMLYDELKAGQPPAAKKIAVPPVAVKPGTASAPQPQGKRAMERLKKSGRVSDLAAVIEAQMNRR